MVDLFTSSFSQARATRTQISRLQTAYTAAQSELSTGRVADVVNSLGSKVGNLAALESRVKVIDSVVATNSLLKGRLESVDLAVGGIQQAATDFRTLLVGAAGGEAPLSRLADRARSFLETLTSFGNTAYGGRHVLSGSDGDRPAIRDFLSAGSDARTAVASSFAAAFNMAPGDPATATIPAADMKSWVDTEFPKLFDATNWETLWAGSSGPAVEARIGEREVATIPSAVADPALRKVVMASVLMLEFGDRAVGSAPFSQALASASSLMDEGIQGMIGFQAANGSLMSRIDSSIEAMNLQKQIYTNEVSQLVEVDAAEVSLRLETLRSQLEASYSITARLSRLSLVNYI